MITIPGRGYRFVAPVREVPRVDAEAAPGQIVELHAGERRVEAAETLLDNQVAARVGLGRHGEAIKLARESIELEPSRVDSLGWVYFRVGREQDALVEFERTGSERGLAYVRALRGDPSGVRALLARLEERSKERYVSPVEFAKLLALLGDKDQAFAGSRRPIARERRPWRASSSPRSSRHSAPTRATPISCIA